MKTVENFTLNFYDGEFVLFSFRIFYYCKYFHLRQLFKVRGVFGTFGNFSQTARSSQGEFSVSCKCYLGVADWAEEAVAKAEILRLIYQGRFLHSNVTLGALGLPFGKTTVMHLVPRENLPEPNSQGEFARYHHVISSFVKVVTKLLVCLFLHFPRQTLHQTRTKFAFLTLFEINFIKESQLKHSFTAY